MSLSFAVRESDMRLGGSNPRLGLAQRTLVPSSTPSAISILSNVLRSTHAGPLIASGVSLLNRRRKNNGVDASSRRHLNVQGGAVVKHLKEEESVEQVIIVGIDLAKRSFQLHGAGADGSVAFRRKLSRERLLDFLASQPRCLVAMEACAGAHQGGCKIGQLGHEVRLLPPIYLKPFVKRHKNDMADAEVICEAAAAPQDLWPGKAFGLSEHLQPAAGKSRRFRGLICHRRILPSCAFPFRSRPVAASRSLRSNNASRSDKCDTVQSAVSPVLSPGCCSAPAVVLKNQTKSKD